LEYIWLDGVTQQVTWTVGEPMVRQRRSARTANTASTSTVSASSQADYQDAINLKDFNRINNIECGRTREGNG